jgi:hypothetical protein
MNVWTLEMLCGRGGKAQQALRLRDQTHPLFTPTHTNLWPSIEPRGWEVKMVCVYEVD